MTSPILETLVVILVAVVTLGILVIIHECGHFLVAKHFRIKVLEFGFGLPPRLWGKKFKDTLWSINALPFGGFVHLLGEDDDNAKNLKNKSSFASQSAVVRIAVVIAGVAMNLALAVALYTVILSTQSFTSELPLLTGHHFAATTQTNSQTILINEVFPSSPASQANLQKGDKVISFNNQPLTSVKQLAELSKSFADQEVVLGIRSLKGKERVVTLTPRSNPPQGQGAIGVSLSGFPVAVLEYRQPLQRVFVGFIHSYNLTAYSIDVLGSLFRRSVEQKDIAPVSSSVSGPVGIFQIIGEITKQQDARIYLDFLAALSLNLAIVNILPFPGLDGGRLIFFVGEVFTRRKINPQVEKYIHTAGFAILLGFILLLTASDLRKIFF